MADFVAPFMDVVSQYGFDPVLTFVVMVGALVALVAGLVLLHVARRLEL